MTTALVGVVSGLGFLVLPGAWLAFGLPLRRLSFVARLALAGVLSPVVIALQFYLVRFVGFSFPASVWILLLLNAGSIWLLVREWQGFRPSWRSLAAFGGIYLLLAGCVAIPWLVSNDIRIFTGHTWMHMGILYQFPGGKLLPEEPELAGVSLAYPWLGHVYWSVLGWALDWSPTRLYVLTNLLWLLWVCLLFYETCRALGASSFASWVGLLWLGLGTNVAGSVIWQAASAFFGLTIRLPGDIRFTPWVRKFIVFELEPFAFGLLVAMLLVSLEALRSRERPWLVITAILLAGIGLIYPLLFPSALGFCGVLLLLIWRQDRFQPVSSRPRPYLVLLAGIAAAVLITLADVQIITEARYSPLLFFSGVRPLMGKFRSDFLALGPFLLAILLLPRQQLFQRGAVLLLAGSLPSVLLRLLFRVGAGYNEYKFLFCTALCLAAVASLALDRCVPQRVSPAFVVLVSVLLVVPAVPAICVQQGMYGFPFFPQVNENSFFIQLKPVEPEARWIEAIRTRTPSDTVVVIRRSNLFLPGVAGRSLWAPPEQARPVPGYWVESRFTLIGERGYATSLVDSRQALLRTMFECKDECKLPEMELQLRSLGRPVAIVFFPGEGKPFLAWLERGRRGRIVYGDNRGTVVWLLEP